MSVETFECTETASEPIEMAEEAISLIESLGLDGQRELVRPREGQARGERFPYREMTDEEEFVYRVLCPEAYPIKEYSRSPIPVRVLQVAAHAQEFFDSIVVWDKASADTKDPVLVGIRKVDSREHNYILARWGNELDEWPAMLKQALDKHRQSLKAQCERAIAELRACAQTLDTAGVDEMSGFGGRPKTASAHIW